MKKIRHLLTALLIIFTWSAQSAQAYESGDILVRAGLVNVSPNEDSDGIAIPALAMPEINGTRAEVDSNSQLGLTFTYMLNSEFGLEVLAATPFTHDITANLIAASLGKIDAGEATHLPPTLSAVWYPLGSDTSVSPYLGAGLNYTIFFEEDVDADLEAAAGSLASLAGSLPMTLDLKNSFGVALQAGLDYQLNEKWHLNGSIRWIDIDTEARFKAKAGSAVPAGTTVITVDNVQIDPWVYQLNIGFRF